VISANLRHLVKQIQTKKAVVDVSLWILWKTYFWFYLSLYLAAAVHDKATEEED